MESASFRNNYASNSMVNFKNFVFYIKLRFF